MIAGMVLVAVIVVTSFFLFSKNEIVKEVTLFKNGAPHRIDNKEMLFTIGSQSLTTARGIDDLMQEIIQPSQVTEMMDKEDGIEIVFEKGQKIYRTGNKYSIEFTKIYIPLSGKYAKFGTVFFFGDNEGYGSVPPYVNTTDVAFRKFIETI